MVNFENIADAEGWTLATQVAVLLEYIENQKSDDAFNDFISEKTEIEDEISNEEDEARKWAR